jgi:hypothetical protein
MPYKEIVYELRQPIPNAIYTFYPKCSIFLSETNTNIKIWAFDDVYATLRQMYFRSYEAYLIWYVSNCVA